MDLFGRVEAFGAFTFLDDVVKRLVTREQTAPYFRRDLTGGTTDGDAGRVIAGVKWNCMGGLLATTSSRR